MTAIQALAASKAGGTLEPFSYEAGALASTDVDIAVESCGICHSDLSMLDNEWGMTTYPFVPGHEVVGRIAAVGDAVTRLQPGDRVGLGWHSGYCMHCDQCMSGHHNMCETVEPTIVGRHGGFAERVRAHEASVFVLPDGLDAATAGPLLCGGIAVFNPLHQLAVPPTARVGVIGIGGLGHLALQFARAWGCNVTAFTSSADKAQEARRLGAHDVLDSKDPSAIEAAAGRFDLLISTVNVALDWNALMSTLRPRGTLHMPGVVTEALDINMVPMLFNQLSVASSPVGSPATIRDMLTFAARHGIAARTEHFPMSRANDAMDHLRAGKARYRIVLDRD